MHWYGGSIAEAVALSKQKNAIFVVFVEADNNEQSAEMASTIEHEVVGLRLANQDHFLAIKLKSGSVDYTHFAQIYQFVPVPSLFFIGRNGTPLEVVCAGVQPDNLATRIDRILQQHYQEKPPAVQPSTSAQNIKSQTTNLLQSEAAGSAPLPPPQGDAAPPPKVDTAPPKVDTTLPKVDTAPTKVDTVPPKVDPPKKVTPAKEETEPPAKIQKREEYDTVCDGDVCVRKPRQAEPGASTSGQPAATKTSEAPQPVAAQESSSDISIEEKMERTKQLIEARRREKEQKEKELEKQKELERRTTGQGVAELKRWQADQELKHIQEERKREKMENELARQRILEQIAQDRAERRARDTPAPASPAPTAAPVAPHTAAVPATPGDAQAQARIQFKLPDGTSHTASFSAADTLRAVQRYVADNLQLSSSNFALWTAFPRRELVDADQSLRDLQLAPSAALLVLPRRTAAGPPHHASSFSVISFISQLLTSLIYEPTLQVYNWIRQRLFPPPAVTPRTPTPPSPQPPTRPFPPASPLRRRGNIHRLPGDAQDDDNNTWNGNSTQQM